MKLVYFIPMLLFLQVKGQSVEMKQLLLNIEKLAQMKAQYQTMVQGYRTLENGYRQVNDLVKGNFLLHQEYLDGLWAVRPSVRQYGRIQTIVQRHRQMVDEYRIVLQQLQSARMLKTQELQGLQSSMAAVVNRSNGLLDDMMLVLTPGKLRMNDEERIGLINRVDEEGSELLQQFRSIVNGYSSLVDRRMLRQREVKSIRSLYGIKQ
jgi:hypothetical protein